MKERYVLLDSIRGITLLSMILYHGMFDLVEIYGLHIPWFVERPGYVWQQSICWIFILPVSYTHLTLPTNSRV